MTAIATMLERVRRAVIRRGGTPDDAEDIVQEAFARLEAYAQSHKVRSQEAFLMRAAINISRDEARRRRVSPFEPGEINLDGVPDASPDAHELLRARERVRRMGAGLQQLPERTRRCLLAQRLDGLTYSEIARREGQSISAVEKQVARAVVFLTKWMDGW